MQELREGVRGEVLTPGDEGYDEARRIWNGMPTTGAPALVVRCTGAADVIAAVGFARANDLPVAVRGGGHSVAGLLDQRRRDRHRSLADERGAGRSRGAPGRGRRRRGLGRRRPRDAGARPGHDGRAGLHAPASAASPSAAASAGSCGQARAGLRQPRRRGRGHRQRPAGARERDREPRTALGPARRRRQLRHRHPVRVRPAPARADGLRRADLVPGRADARPAARVPRLGGRARRTR